MMGQDFLEQSFPCFVLLQLITNHNVQEIDEGVIVIVLVLEATDKQYGGGNSTDPAE
jgi:hypothetical protein